jgi:alkylhydroperoxidase family enzyme
VPRLKQVSRQDASTHLRAYYDLVFGTRDPVAQPGTATGTPGNWWTVFGLVPYIFEHTTRHMNMFGIYADNPPSKLDPTLRELAILRTGYAQESQFVYSQHCKVARGAGLSEEEIRSISSWPVASVYSERQRAVLAYVDCLIVQSGRVSDDLFDTLKRHVSDEDILEITYHALMYNLYAVSSKALRLEYDDVSDRITEIPAPQSSASAASANSNQ